VSGLEVASDALKGQHRLCCVPSFSDSPQCVTAVVAAAAAVVVVVVAERTKLVTAAS
jgi:hypothetical protein